MEAGGDSFLPGHTTANRPRSPQSTRKPHQRRLAPKRRGLGLRTRLILISLAAIVVLILWAILARALAPSGNTSASRFDAIIVLGSPADADGNPTPVQLARVTEGVREYERGVAPRLIMTGGSTLHGFVEAQVMARTAEAQGVPASALFIEPEARDTIQNACYSVRIMQKHGWRSAEVVSAASHLPRVGMIFNRLPIAWRAHEAPSIEPESALYAEGATALEVLKTARYLVYANWGERCE